jgi:hypothetical protein
LKLSFFLSLAVGYLTISILDKTHLTSNSSDSFGSEGSIASRARAVLFVGVALLAGGFAGSLVSLPLEVFDTRLMSSYGD